MEKKEVANRIASLIIEVHKERYKALEEKNKGKYRELTDIVWDLIEDLNHMGFKFYFKDKWSYELYEKDEIKVYDNF